MQTGARASFPSRRRLVLILTIAAATGVVLGVIGPFGNYLNGTAPLRIAYWLVFLMATTGVYLVLLPWAERLAKRLRAPIWIWLPLLVAAVQAPVALASRAVALRMWPVVERVGLIEWYGQGLMIAGLAMGAYVWWGRRPEGDGRAKPQAASSAPRLGRDVLCLQMEDHYVRVHRATGSELVLTPLARAVAALDGVEGLQTHRSWWVARDAVEGVVEDGRRLRLRLRGGLEAPVSRSRIARLRADGWLAD